MRITPKGWVREFLQTQLDGLTGHIETAGFPFDRVQWGQPDYQTDNENPMWWVYEQTAYWLDGLTRCAIVLEDARHLARAREMINNVLRNADADGYLGPKFLKVNEPWNRWPHVVFFRACMALYEYDHDHNIVDGMTRHYLNSPADYSCGRDVYNVEIMLWLYEKTGNRSLLNMAEASYAAYNAKATDDNCDAQAMSDKKPYAHGVTYNEYFKLGALLYTHTGNEKYLDVSQRAYEKIDQYFMLPGGCHCSNEFFISNDYMQSAETCNVTDYTWALSYLLRATEDGSYADRIEKCVFNAGIGAVLENFRGLQYLSCANQVIADKHSNHNVFFAGDKWMSFRPNPGTECCPGNVNRFMPNFVWNSWTKNGDGLWANQYFSGTVQTQLRGNHIRIEEETNYPIEENVRFHITAEEPFILHCRKPGWAKKFKILVNGQNWSGIIHNGFAHVQVQGDCQIQLLMESSIEAHRKGGKVWFSKGPLVYSLGMKGMREIDREETRCTDAFPAYNIYPDKEWRYCVTGKPVFTPAGDVIAFDLDRKLPYLEVPARVIENLELCRKNKVRNCYDLYEKKYKYVTGQFVFTPRLPSRNKMVLSTQDQIIRLYPYGACKLRITVFNQK